MQLVSQATWRACLPSLEYIKVTIPDMYEHRLLSLLHFLHQGLLVLLSSPHPLLLGLSPSPLPFLG